MRILKTVTLVVISLLLCLSVFAGCASMTGNDLAYVQQKTTRNAGEEVHVYIDKLVFDQKSSTAWELVKRADIKSLEQQIAENLKKNVPGFNSVSLRVANNGLNADFIFDFIPNLVYQNVGAMSLDTSGRDVFQSQFADVEVYSTSDVTSGPIKDVPNVSNYYLNSFNSSVLATNINYFNISELGLDGIIQYGEYYLTVPGKVEYMSGNFDYKYDWFKDETTIKGINSSQVILLTTLGMPFEIKLIIAGIILAIVFVLVFIITLRNRPADATGTVYGIAGEYKDAAFKIKSGEELIFGRDPDMANVVFPAKYDKISRKHCGISYDKSRRLFSVTDYSTNGTFTNDGTRLKVNQPNYLHSNSIIYLGNRDNMLKLK